MLTSPLESSNEGEKVLKIGASACQERKNRKREREEREREKKKKKKKDCQHFPRLCLSLEQRMETPEIDLAITGQEIFMGSCVRRTGAVISAMRIIFALLIRAGVVSRNLLTPFRYMSLRLYNSGFDLPSSHLTSSCEVQYCCLKTLTYEVVGKTWPRPTLVTRAHYDKQGWDETQSNEEVRQKSTQLCLGFIGCGGSRHKHLHSGSSGNCTSLPVYVQKT